MGSALVVSTFSGRSDPFDPAVAVAAGAVAGGSVSAIDVLLRQHVGDLLHDLVEREVAGVDLDGVVGSPGGRDVAALVEGVAAGDVGRHGRVVEPRRLGG